MVEKSHTAGFWPSVYDPLRTFGARVADWFAPASDASSNDNVYTITMELPGVAEDDIAVTVENGVVTIKGEKSSKHEEKGDTYFFSERQYGAFSRSFRLPEDALAQDVQAQLTDGVLVVRIPKRAAASPESKQVKVTRG